MKRAQLLSAWLLFASSLAAQHDFYDCTNALILCSKEPVVVENLSGPGAEEKELSNVPCLSDKFPETNSIWLKWKAGTNGTLAFTILPLHENDDIDFILFKMSGEINDCGAMSQIRCMASGKYRGIEEPNTSVGCTGATGLDILSSDEKEASGCSETDDNFLANIEVSTGEVFALFINNYHSNGGFLLEFTGSSEMAKIPSLCSLTSDDQAPISLNDTQDPGLLIGDIWPNPAGSEINLPISSLQDYGEGLLQIISSQGELLQNKNITIKTGEQTVNVTLDAIPTGVYFLKAVIGEKHHITRFSKL